MTGDTMDAVAAAPQPISARPMTGAEYLESLRDGREIWLYGERVADVTRHPAFRNTARMIARLYDALHDPQLREVLTTATDTGSGGYTHPARATSITRRCVPTLINICVARVAMMRNTG